MFATDTSTLLSNADPIKLYKTEGAFKDEIEKYPTEIAECYEYDEESRTYFLPDYMFSEWQMHIPTIDEPIQLGASTVSNIVMSSEEIKAVLPSVYGGIMGVPFVTANELHYTKKGLKLLLQPELDNSNLYWEGHNEEPSTRRAFLKLYREAHPDDIVKLTNEKATFRCGIKNDDGTLKYPFMFVNDDGHLTINEYKGLLECKTLHGKSPMKNMVKKGICPFKYFVQCQYLMLAHNVSYTFIIFKMGISLADYKIIRVDRDNKFIEVMMKIICEFVDGFNNNVEPSVKGEDVVKLSEFYRKKAGNYDPSKEKVELPSELELDLYDIQTINMNLTELAEKQEDLKGQRARLLNKIFPIVGEANEAYLPLSDDSRIELKLKNANERHTLDEKRLKADYPEIYESYCIPKFDANKFKKEMANLFEEYRTASDRLTTSKANYCEVIFQ